MTSGMHAFPIARGPRAGADAQSCDGPSSSQWRLARIPVPKPLHLIEKAAPCRIKWSGQPIAELLAQQEVAALDVGGPRIPRRDAIAAGAVKPMSGGVENEEVVLGKRLDGSLEHVVEHRRKRVRESFRVTTAEPTFGRPELERDVIRCNRFRVGQGSVGAGVPRRAEETFCWTRCLLLRPYGRYRRDLSPSRADGRAGNPWSANMFGERELAAAVEASNRAITIRSIAASRLPPATAAWR